jgi:hypothetical protein
MIYYHGGPITPISVAVDCWRSRHAMVSFANPDQISIAAEVCQSWAIDNGAFTFWGKDSKSKYPMQDFIDFLAGWYKHPALDWVIVPDDIDGDEKDNDNMLHEFTGRFGYHYMRNMVPVWHMHEDITRLESLCHDHGRVALGSSGKFSQPNTEEWWDRMSEAMDAICDEEGRPPCKLHGLRMMNPTIFAHLPLASADSTNVAQNLGAQAWKGAYQPLTKGARALVLIDRCESHASAVRWNRETRHTQMNFDLIG